MSNLGGLGLDLEDEGSLRQVVREEQARQVALGKRARAVLRGDLGPVLKRWASSTIQPVSLRLRELSEAILAGDTKRAQELSTTALLGAPRFAGSPSLKPILQWALKGDHADDLVLAAFGTVLREVTNGGAHGGPGGSGQAKGVPVTRLILHAGDACRETALGQFLTQVQGAKAMLGVKRKGAPEWHGRKRLGGAANLLAGQVRSGLASLSAAPDYEIPARGKEVVKVLTPKGDERRIDLRRPEPGDWDLLDLARQVEGEKDNNRPVWATLAMLILMCAQAEAGWFDLVKQSKSVLKGGTRLRRPMGAAHALVLSEQAHAAIAKDLDKWLRMGFTREPMVVPPVDGDYLTVKHKPVAGGRGPMGYRTDAKGTAPWVTACETLAATPWAINTGVLDGLTYNEALKAAVRDEDKGVPDDLQRETILAAHKSLAAEPAFYMPLYMDFRGRIYTQTSEVTYQGSKLQKALLRFPKGHAQSQSSSIIRASAMHTSALVGLDKEHPDARLAWYMDKFRPVAECLHKWGWEDHSVEDLLRTAEDPLGLAGALWLQRLGFGVDYDCLPVQLDGTCNGLQHLSALFRDETAAPYVNLTAANNHATPGDAYMAVAALVQHKLRQMADPWVQRVVTFIKVDRKMCKRPVMTLPYGATKGTVEGHILEAALGQRPPPDSWTAPAKRGPSGSWESDEEAIASGYGAFADRPLERHPLFHQDMRKLAHLVWEAIGEVFPRALLAMQAFRDIAKGVGERTLEWQMGYSLPGGYPPLWVVQAKAKSSAVPLALKGLHLPNSIRSLKMHPGRDEVDAHSHVTGIVANFIHSQDADHLVGALEAARMRGVRSMGATHDALKVRPSDAGKMGTALRESFASKYLTFDPLALPVALRDAKGDAEAFGSWYALAESVGVEFPGRGTWEPAEVLESRWFFS